MYGHPIQSLQLTECNAYVSISAARDGMLDFVFLLSFLSRSENR
jgi:hypothetical protein